MADFTTEFVKGKIYWAKVVGKPVNNYEGDAREWTFDFVPENTTFLKQHGLLDRLKEPRGVIEKPFLRLKKPELDSEGKLNDPIKIVDADNKAWGSALIGNGSSVDLRLTVADWGRGKKKSIWTKAIRVTDLVEYKSNEFAGMDNSDDEPRSSRKTKAKSKPLSELDEDLDDEIPFDF